MRYYILDTLNNVSEFQITRVFHRPRLDKKIISLKCTGRWDLLERDHFYLGRVLLWDNLLTTVTVDKLILVAEARDS